MRSHLACHILQLAHLIPNTLPQIDRRRLHTPMAIVQLRMQIRHARVSLDRKVDLRRAVGEVLAAPDEFAWPY